MLLLLHSPLLLLLPLPPFVLGCRGSLGLLLLLSHPLRGLQLRHLALPVFLLLPLALSDLRLELLLPPTIALGCHLLFDALLFRRLTLAPHLLDCGLLLSLLVPARHGLLPLPFLPGLLLPLAPLSRSGAVLLRLPRCSILPPAAVGTRRRPGGSARRRILDELWTSHMGRNALEILPFHPPGVVSGAVGYGPQL